MKIKNKNIAIVGLIIVLFMASSYIYGATTPTLINKLNTAFKNIKEYLIKLSAPVAAVAIITGVLIRKLSFR